MAALIALLLVGALGGASGKCLDGQFYHEPTAGCRNCTDIGHLFHSRQDWLGAEVISDSDSNNNKDTLGGRKFGADGEVLSRLIGPLEAPEAAAAPTEPDDQALADDDSTSSHQDKQEKLVARFLMAASTGAELLEAVDQCRQQQNQSACQMWSNLCLATMYAHSDSGSPPAPLKSSLSTPLKGPRKAWQQCEQFGLNSVCNSLRDWWRLERKPSSVDILSIFAADEPLASKAIASAGLQLRLNQPIQLLAYKYTHRGHFLGVDQFGATQLERFCLGSFAPIENNKDPLRVGKSMDLRCALPSSGAPRLNETLFIDLYLGYQQNGAFFVKPVPILIKNLLYNGQQINRRHPRDPSRWKLVHRFFFPSILDLEAQDEALVYAKSVELDLKFRRQDKGLLLSSILLTLDYDYITGAGNQSRHAPVTEITISQTLVDMLSYRKDFDLLVAILSIASSTWSMLKCYHIQKCHGLVKLDLESLFRFLLISCDTLANLFALVSLSFAGLLFVALKFQVSPASMQLLGPSQDLDEALGFNIQLAFVFKLIGLAHTLYNPLQADIFFIDWERPKMLTSAEILQHFSHHNKPSAAAKEGEQNQLAAGQQQQHQSAASFWRPYTVVNKWLQMQTHRRQDTTLQLFLFVCALNLTQVLQLATLDADQSTSSGSFALRPTISRSFRLFLLSAVYLSLSAAQLLLKRHLLEPTFGDKLHQFVDLCSVANVSLFCMLYPKFGYYLHGRNANGSGECGIAEMNALLEREERDLCSKRGLAPNSDQQAFVLILPRIINDHYRKLSFRDVQNQLAAASPPLANANKQSLLRSMLSLSTFSQHRSHMGTVAERNRAINQFLINFLEHVYKDIDYSIRERRKFESSFLSSGYDEEADEEHGGHGSAAANRGRLEAAKAAPATFCKDPGNSFTALIWLGHEWDLILFELLAILFLDFWIDSSTWLAIFILWTLHKLLERFYAAAAKRNLVAKAMLDEKFLAN